jgi:hypothetical protein
LIKQEARMAAERDIATLGDRIDESRREHQRTIETTEKAKSELRSLLMTHLALLERPSSAPSPVVAPSPTLAPPSSEPVTTNNTHA